MEVAVGDIERTPELGFGSLARSICSFLMPVLVLVLVMPEVLGLRAGFVLAVRAHGRPAELQRHEHQQ